MPVDAPMLPWCLRVFALVPMDVRSALYGFPLWFLWLFFDVVPLGCLHCLFVCLCVFAYPAPFRCLLALLPLPG